MELEKLLQSLSDEMLRLKSSSEQYEETKEQLQNICNLIEKISITHMKVTENMSEFLAEMEKMQLESGKTREYIQNIYGKAKDFFEAETQRHDAALEESLSKKLGELSNEFAKENDKILQQMTNQSKAMKLVKPLILLGVSMEVIIIILIIITLIQ